MQRKLEAEAERRQTVRRRHEQDVREWDWD